MRVWLLLVVWLNAGAKSATDCYRRRVWTVRENVWQPIDRYCFSHKSEHRKSSNGMVARRNCRGQHRQNKTSTHTSTYSSILHMTFHTKWKITDCLCIFFSFRSPICFVCIWKNCILLMNSLCLYRYSMQTLNFVIIVLLAEIFRIAILTTNTKNKILI